VGFFALSSALAAGLCGAAALSGFFGAGRAAFPRARARAFGAGRSFLFKTLIGLAFFLALRGCFAFDLRFALTILTSSSPVGPPGRKKGADST
jgi:hypothetical protein